MLIYLSFGVAVWVLGVAVSQGFFAFVYSMLFFRSSSATLGIFQPKAAVILALRGSDPYLVANMSSVLDQDYPEFTLFIIVDSHHDAAWPEVRKVQALAPHRVATMVLQNPLASCSLKCSSLAEVIESLDASYQVVAFLDADAVPHRTWLRELVAPLADPSIGVTTGNRWYLPHSASWGTMVRYFWNAGAVVQVWLNDIVWGGSMALRRETMDRVELVSSLRSSFVDDGAVVRQVRSAGLKTRFVPTVILPNREDITIPNFIAWSERQLVAARSSGSGWPIVLLHAFSISCCVFLPLTVLVLGAMSADRQVLLLGLISFLIYWSSAILSTLVIESGIQIVLKRARVSAKWKSLWAAAKYVPSIMLSHLVYFRALAGASLKKQVSWRGIDYQFLGINEVRMIRYRPYLTGGSQDGGESII